MDGSQSTPRKARKPREAPPPVERRIGTRSQKPALVQSQLNFTRHKPRVSRMNIEAPRITRITSKKEQKKAQGLATRRRGLAHARLTHTNWRTATRAANRLRRRRANPVLNSGPNTINTFAKWDKKMASNARANRRNARERAQQDAEALAAAASGDAADLPPPPANAANENWGGEEEAAGAAGRINEAEAAGDSVIEMFPREVAANSNRMNHGRRELQMIIDDKYREFMDDDNQAKPVRKRLLTFLEKGGIDMPRDTFDAAFKHAAAEYKRR